MPRVSILLTCYNHLDYLPAAHSIRTQTFQDFEVIAIDDGSTDVSREWLASQNNITLVLNEKNLGTYGTLNKGLDLATGEFIAVLNDDDVWMPEKLANGGGATTPADLIISRELLWMAPVGGAG